MITYKSFKIDKIGFEAFVALIYAECLCCRTFYVWVITR